MNINELKPGDKIEVFNDSTFCVRDDFDLDVSDEIWRYKITYVDRDYIIINVLTFPDSSPYLLANCESIKRLE